MKKAIFGILALALMFATSSCKKNVSAGTWTFKAVTYTGVTCVGGGGQYTASTFNNNNSSTYGELELVFYSAPVAAGSYTVTNITIGVFAGQVGIYVNTNGSSVSYESTGSGAKKVNVSYTGQDLTASGMNIEVVNASDPTDSAAVTFNITQTE
jgi:hypothetical protein